MSDPFSALQPFETELIGQWIVVNGRAQADPIAKRIDWLSRARLDEIATTEDGWSTLYMDRADARYWERTYPQGDGHGGGPPSLRNVRKEAVEAKYRLSAT